MIFLNNKTSTFMLQAVLLMTAVPARSQVVIDWANKKLESFPQIVNSRMNVTVSVHDVNDLLYQYKIKMVAAPRTIDDAAGIFLPGAAAIAKAGVPVPGACTAALAQLNAKLKSVTEAMADIFDCSKQLDKDGKLISVPLATTLERWNTEVRAPMKIVTGGNAAEGSTDLVTKKCDESMKEAREAALGDAEIVVGKVASIQKRIDGLHVVQQVENLDPETNYTVTVTEFCGNNKTSEFTAIFSPSSHLLTLSLGTLLTRTQQRSYTSTKDPANGPQNLLNVNGAGYFSPLGAALLNYQIPYASWNNWGFALSSGLALRFGANDVSASSLGWFAGPSVHFYHRLFISAGAHIGQFTDYPPGLRSGGVVPANYGDLTGQTRSTSRFAFAITYQTKGFAAGSTTAKTSTTSASGSVK